MAEECLASLSNSIAGNLIEINKKITLKQSLELNLKSTSAGNNQCSIIVNQLDEITTLNTNPIQKSAIGSFSDLDVVNNKSETDLKEDHLIANNASQTSETPDEVLYELDDTQPKIGCDKVGIYIETPVVDEGNVSITVNDYENSSVRPKRISDDFFSSDDGEEDKSAPVSISITEGETSAANHGPIRTEDNSNGIYGKESNFLEDDTSSSCSNMININNDESRLELPSTVSSDIIDNPVDDTEQTTKSSRNQHVEEQSGSFYDNDVQSMDAIERKDFEREQKLIGGVIIKASSLVNSENKLNLEYLETYKQKTKVKAVSDFKVSVSQKELSTTPTSSRCATTRLTKSTAKLNLSACLDRESEKHTSESSIYSKTNDKSRLPHSSNSSLTESASSSQSHRIDKQVEAFLNSNSNDSLSSDKSYNTSSSHSLPNFYNKNNNSELLYRRGEIITSSSSIKCASSSSSTSNINKTGSSSLSNEYSDPVASTSSHTTKCQFASFCCPDSARVAGNKETPNTSKSSNESVSSGNMFQDKKNSATSTTTTSTSKTIRNYDIGQISTASSSSTVISRAVRPPPEGHFEDPMLEPSQISLPTEQTENDFDDETWADCEDGSDEEVCTCYNDSNEYQNTYIEDELPSRDVDLSGYIQLVTISEDMFLQENTATDTPSLQRKRKINDRAMDSDMSFGETTPVGRKRMALENVVSPRSLHTPSSQNLIVTSPSSAFSEQRRTPRSLIPTKDNPPPELCDWLLQFQRWSHAERLLAVDRLIEHCEPTQVRHMMKVIEPQFQRDFISLLPKELALQVLSYLEPKDLLRAAQTCRSWRFLCDDNLLWKEKCKQAQIVIEPKTDRPKRGRAGNMPPISSPWKAAYMRQHIIELNWRSRPIRQPKVLKGHDDHVITCLQFCGNRIVSGSDDNTLKVWSAITGKCLRTLVGHTGGVWSSQMSGNIIISGSTDRTLKVWNVETGQCIHTLLGHTSTVRCMHLHGNKVVSGSRDATLRVWDVEQGTCLHVLVGHLAAVRCVQYDGKLIVSGAYDYMVKVWNPERQECLHTLQGHTNRVYSLQFDGIHVVSGSLDTSIRVWDAETGSCKHTLMGHQSLTSGMELRQNILVSGNADSTVKVWDITTGQCLQTLSGPNKHQSAVTCLQFNSRFVITSSDDGTVKLWDVKTGEFIRNLVALDSGGSGGVVWRIRANDTKLICAVGSRNGTEETKLMVLDFDVEGACLKCS